MTTIGYHASHEQLPPRDLLSAVRLAESVGFDAAMCSDHLAPWTPAQGESGFAWTWLGAALASTRFPLGVVTAPGQRYHPVIVAQAIATAEQMFPGRFWAALGSGEAINEHVTGTAWPEKAYREQRLHECVDTIRRLLAGETVTLDSTIRVDQARVWSRPESPPPLLGAAVSAKTASWVAGWADGLITVGADPAATEAALNAFRDAGGRGDAMLQVHVSLADTEEEALRVARAQWSHSTAPAELMWDIQQPEEFEALADPIEEKLDGAVIISASADEMAERVASAAQGFDQVYIHHVGVDQGPFLRRCEEQLLPALRRLM